MLLMKDVENLFDKRRKIKMKKYTKKTKEKFYKDIAENLIRGCDSSITPIPKVWTYFLVERFDVLKNSIYEISSIMEKFKYKYNKPFFRAAERRQAEEDNYVSRRVFYYGGKKFSFKFSLRCSCNWNYLDGFYYKDGKRTNFTTVKNLPVKMDEIIQFAANMTDEDKVAVEKLFYPMFYNYYGI